MQTRTLADIVKEVEAVDRECLELSVRRASTGEFMLGNRGFDISTALVDEMDEVRSERRVDKVCHQLSALKCGSKAARKPQRSPIVRVDTVKRILKQKCCDTIKVSHIRIFAIKIGISALNNAAVQIAWIFDLNEDCAPMRFHCDMGQIGEIVVYVVPQSR